MTDIPEDIAKAGERAVLLWLGTAPDGIHRQPLSEAIARAILADRAAQAERIRELDNIVRAVKAMRSVDSIAAAIHGFEREKRAEAWAKIDEMIRAAIPETKKTPPPANRRRGKKRRWGRPPLLERRSYGGARSGAPKACHCRARISAI